MRTHRRMAPVQPAPCRRKCRRRGVATGSRCRLGRPAVFEPLPGCRGEPVPLRKWYRKAPGQAPPGFQRWLRLLFEGHLRDAGGAAVPGAAGRAAGEAAGSVVIGASVPGSSGRGDGAWAVRAAFWASAERGDSNDESDSSSSFLRPVVCLSWTRAFGVGGDPGGTSPEPSSGIRTGAGRFLGRSSTRSGSRGVPRRSSTGASGFQGRTSPAMKVRMSSESIGASPSPSMGSESSSEPASSTSSGFGGRAAGFGSEGAWEGGEESSAAEGPSGTCRFRRITTANRAAAPRIPSTAIRNRRDLVSAITLNLH